MNEELQCKLAICYDFDNTLSKKDMQCFSFIKSLNISEDEFWEKCDEITNRCSSDRILSYMLQMIKSCKESGINLTRDYLVSCGKNIELFDGVATWFSRINEFGKSIGVEVEHYIISSGMKEMIEGTTIAKYFKEIYAGYYIYDEENHPIWPALAINYTNKTQFLYRINKGILNITDDSINGDMPHEVRPVPFENMVYIGDSSTDIPCMRLVMKSGGHAIGVYKNEKGKKIVKDLLSNNKINYFTRADYTAGSELESLVKAIAMSVCQKEKLRKISNSQRDNQLSFFKLHK